MAGHAGARTCGHGACLHPRASRPGPAPAVPPQADHAHRRGDRAPAGRRGGGGEDHHRPGRRRPRRDAEPARAPPDPFDRPHRPTRDPRRGSLSAGTRHPHPRASRSAGSGLGRPGLHGGGKGRASHAGVACATGPSGDLGHSIRSRPHDLRGRRQPGVEVRLRGHGCLAVRDGRRRRLLLDEGHAPPRAAHQRGCRVRARGGQRAPCGATVPSPCAWRRLCPGPRPCGSPGPREPPDRGRCSRGIGRTKEGSA